MGSLSHTIGHPPREWLKRRLTVDDAERVVRDEGTAMGVPVSARWLREWSDFKNIIRDGDELWQFEWFPDPLCGAAGFCVVRDGSSVASIVTQRA